MLEQNEKMKYTDTKFDERRLFRMKKRLIAPGLVVALLLAMFALNCLEAVRGSLAAPPFQSERPGGQAADQGIDADRKSFYNIRIGRG